jgi:hypothetical protein
MILKKIHVEGELLLFFLRTRMDIIWDFTRRIRETSFVFRIRGNLLRHFHHLCHEVVCPKKIAREPFRAHEKRTSSIIKYDWRWYYFLCLSFFYNRYDLYRGKSRIEVRVPCKILADLWLHSNSWAWALSSLRSIKARRFVFVERPRVQVSCLGFWSKGALWKRVRSAILGPHNFHGSIKIGQLEFVLDDGRTVGFCRTQPISGALSRIVARRMHHENACARQFLYWTLQFPRINQWANAWAIPRTNQWTNISGALYRICRSKEAPRNRMSTPIHEPYHFKDQSMGQRMG